MTDVERIGTTLAGIPTSPAPGPAVALMLSLGITSIVKATLLSRILKASVSPLRWPLLWAFGAAMVVGVGFTALPAHLEWVELVVGEPAILATYLFVLWRFAFGPADRALFGKMPDAEEATLPHAGGVTR